MILVTVPIVEISKNGNLFTVRCPLFIEINIALTLQFMQPILHITFRNLLQSSFSFETINDSIHFSSQSEVSFLEWLEIRVIFDYL